LCQRRVGIEALSDAGNVDVDCRFDHLPSESHRHCRESGIHGQESETRRVLFNGTGEFMTFVSNSAGESGTATDCCPRQCHAQERRFIAGQTLTRAWRRKVCAADRNTGAFLLSLDCHKRLLSTSRMKLTLPPARFADGAQRVCRPDPQGAHRNQERESACAEGVIP
jgi:hypothetical protein